LKSYLAALERAQIVLWITVGAAIVNALLNYALIFGNWGAPELGITGAAIASVAVQVFSLILMVIYTALVTPEHALYLRLWRPDWEAFRNIFSLGLPIGLTLLAEVGLFSASAIMMGWIGTIELAAHGIALQLASLTFMIHLGLANAATIRAGRALGRRNMIDLRRGALVATTLSALLALASVVLFISMAETLVGLFIDPADPARPAVLAAGVILLYVAALFQLADAGQVLALGLLRGLHDTRAPMIFATISYWVVGVPVSYLLGFKLGFDGVGIWMGLVIGLMIAWIMMTTRFWRRVNRMVL
jgi:multidrug resistance protein, MATE family